jgi:hypothetical protein
MIWVSSISESSDDDNKLWVVSLFAYFMIALKENILQIIFRYNLIY